MNVAVDCPKCDGKMVPLSSIEMRGNFAGGGMYAVVPYYEWRCVKCGYTVKVKR